MPDKNPEDRPHTRHLGKVAWIVIAIGFVGAVVYWIWLSRQQ